MDDIEKYTEPRYVIAKVVARAAMKTIESIPGDKLSILKQLLFLTKMTAVCEVLQPQYQHIVNLSYLAEPRINFLMFTSNATKEETSSFTAIAPHYGLMLAHSLTFHIPTFKVISVNSVSSRYREVRNCLEKEGDVFYYITNDAKTIGLNKVKSAWYILLRALREKLDYFLNSKSKDKYTLEEKINSINKRFKEIQRWLQFTDDYLKSWLTLAEKCLLWCVKRIAKNEFQSSSIRPEFPIIWKKFLDDTDSTDQIPLVTVNSQSAQNSNADTQLK